MKYTLHSLEEYQTYIDTSLPYSETLPTVDGYNFDESTGIMTVNRTKYDSGHFNIFVPVRNLKIGDKVKAKIDVKILGGLPPLLGTTLTAQTGAIGKLGIHKQQYYPSEEVADFQTLRMEAIYEGYDTDTLAVSYNNSGILYVAFRMLIDFDSSHVQFKNLTIDTENNISGIFPGTRIYHGMIKYIPEEGFIFDEKVGSNNTKDLSLVQSSNDKYTINFAYYFSKIPTIYFNNMFQGTGNNCLYEVVLNTVNTRSVVFCVRDLVNNVLIYDFSKITVPLYINFIIIGD